MVCFFSFPLLILETIFQLIFMISPSRMYNVPFLLLLDLRDLSQFDLNLLTLVYILYGAFTAGLSDIPSVFTRNGYVSSMASNTGTRSFSKRAFLYQYLHNTVVGR